MAKPKKKPTKRKRATADRRLKGLKLTTKQEKCLIKCAKTCAPKLIGAMKGGATRRRAAPTKKPTKGVSGRVVRVAKAATRPKFDRNGFPICPGGTYFVTRAATYHVRSVDREGRQVTHGWFPSVAVAKKYIACEQWSDAFKGDAFTITKESLAVRRAHAARQARYNWD